LERANEGVANLGVTLPIFDGGLARERLREAQGVVAGAEVSRRQATDLVQVDVQQAYILLVQARDRVAVSDVEVAQAQESYRLAIVRYNAGVSQQPGVSPQLEFSNAQNALALAQSNHINALYDYNNARAQLDRAVGRYSFTGAGPGYRSVPPKARE
jgi:outer membrane protein TolC